MRVLFISLSLPPFAESQTIRSAYWIEAAAAQGVQFGLLTAEVGKENQDSSLNALIPEGIPIWRTPEPKYDQRRRALRAQPFGRWLDYVYANAAYRLLAPDVRRGWERWAYQLAHQILPDFRPDLILSASGSCTAHIAAHRLAQETGLTWIADLGDPWSLVDWHYSEMVLKAIWNTVLENRYLPNTNHLIVTTEPTQTAYQGRWGQRTPPISVIYYGYRDADFMNATPPHLRLPIEIAYVGAASRRSRNLIPLIRSLAAIVGRSQLNYHLTIVGETSAFFRREVEKQSITNVQFTGRVSYRESIDWMLKSDLLVLVGNQGRLQIPGKTFLYLASGRPILYLSQLPLDQDPTWALLRPFAGVVAVPNRSEAITEWFVAQKPHNWRTLFEQAWTRRSSSALSKYEIHTQVVELIQIMQGVKGR
jgi:hypothetical protein